MKDIDDLYDCLEQLEEAYRQESLNWQNSMVVNQARLKLENAIAKIEKLLNQHKLGE